MLVFFLFIYSVLVPVLGYLLGKRRKGNFLYFSFFPMIVSFPVFFVVFLFSFFLNSSFFHTSVPFMLPIFVGLIVAFSVLLWLFFKKPNIVTCFNNTVEYVLKTTVLLIFIINFCVFLSVFLESVQFFKVVPFFDFLLGTNWAPDAYIPDNSQQDFSYIFGALPVFWGTLYSSVLALSLAVPVGVFAAVYVSEYMSGRLRLFFKPCIELLAGIPSIVYGVFAILFVAPLVGKIFHFFGQTIEVESVFVASSVLAIMLIPYIFALTEDVLSATPRALKMSSLALGATQSETIMRLILPSAISGVFSSVLLAFSRAIGETMVMVLAAGMLAHISLNPFVSMTTVTAQIVSLLISDSQFGSPKTLSAFALGLSLFVLTFIFNIVSLVMLRRYKKKYAL